MMKMVMKIQKSQVVSTDKLTTTGVTKTFRRTPAIQAGFTTIDVMCIGGAGGYNTQAALNYWGAGGGGGGSVKARLLLKDISESNNYACGAKGPDGSAGGFDGGESYFGGLHAYGGKGAGGISGGWGNADVYASIGGEGGGNNYDPSQGGSGGHAPFSWGGLGYGFANAENGTWVDTGGGNGHGGGGGGGGGRSARAGYVADATTGYFGAVPGNAQCPPTTWLGGNYGGQGGGADLFMLTGAHELYGVYGPGVTMFILS